MSNHFHILLEVPQRPPDKDLPDDEALIDLVRKTLGEGAATKLRWELEHFRSFESPQAAEELREKWFARMWDVSQYMKVLKQRFTQWYNGRHNRRGTLWEDRFKSVLVEGKAPALKAMAAYIDLNPVRAKICEDPKDYRWCNYGEAVAGGRKAKLAQAAVAWLDSFTIGSDGSMRERAATQLTRKETKDKNVLAPLEESLRRYRCFLFGIPESELRQKEEIAREDGNGEAQIFRQRISRKKALEVLAQGGRLQRSDYLRCRVRYFVDGAAIGSKDFIEEVFQASKDLFHPNRITGPRSLRGIEMAPKPLRLYNLRQLGKDALG